MLEVVVLISVLSIFTLVVAVLYGRRIRDAYEKYAEARTVVEDIIVSFNRQLHRQEDKLEASVRKVDLLSTRSKFLPERLEDQGKKIKALSEKVNSLAVSEKELAKIDALENKLDEVASLKDTVLKRIAEIEKQRVRQKEAGAKIESAIPIKREKALAPLTETELKVLELLAVEGEKTAPEIKEKIKLSREHSARLMKKLYEEGYLERSMKKIPFTYRLKEEMRKILKKPEQKT